MVNSVSIDQRWEAFVSEGSGLWNWKILVTRPLGNSPEYQCSCIKVNRLFALQSHITYTKIVSVCVCVNFSLV